MVNVKGLHQQSTVTGGRIEDSTSGIIKLFNQVGGKDIIRSTAATKYPVGAIVEVSIRNDAKQTISRIMPVPNGSSFRVTMATLAPTFSPKELNKKVSAIMEQASLVFSIPEWDDRLKEARKLGVLGPVDVSVGLAYTDADHIRFELNKAFGDEGYFVAQPLSVEQATELGVEPEVSIDQLEYVNGYFISPALRPVFGVAARIMALSQHLNLMFVGASGYGKTTAAKVMAEWLGADFLIVPCAAISDVTGWFGELAATDGSTHFDPSSFTKIIERGNCVVLLDEANRLEPWLTGPLFNILDSQRSTEVRNMKIKVGPGVVFVLSMNIGAQYAGTFSVDSAFKNRIDGFIELGAPPQDVEVEILASMMLSPEQRPHSQILPSDITRKAVPPISRGELVSMVTVLNGLREIVERENYSIDVSTRSAIKMGNLMNLGLTLGKALELVITNAAPMHERKSIVDQIQSRLGSLGSTKSRF